MDERVDGELVREGREESREGLESPVAAGTIGGTRRRKAVMVSVMGTAGV